MTDIQFSSPETIDSAVALLLEDERARVLAGGTDLIVQMQSGIRATGHVVDIKRIPELTQVVQNPDGSWTLGAAVCSAELNENQALKAAWPGVLEAADLIGSMQVQGRATLAGNLCNASPAADSVPALVAAGATVTIAGAQGHRTLPVEDIPVAPGQTSLERSDMVIAVNLPAKPAHSGDAYLRFIPRSEMDIAVVGVGVFLTLDNAGNCSAARIALGAVAPTVLVFAGDDAKLVGRKLDSTTLDEAASVLRAACRPIDDKRGTAEYRTEMAGVMFKRAALIALDRATS